MDLGQFINHPQKNGEVIKLYDMSHNEDNSYEDDIIENNENNNTENVSSPEMKPTI